jgi:hypothetical protein
MNEAVKTIILEKAESLKKGLVPNSEYNVYIRDVLGQFDTEGGEKLAKAFVFGAIDAMIFDVGSALNCPEFKDRDIRKILLNEIFQR